MILERQTPLTIPMGVHQLANKSLVITALELETIWFALLFAATLEKWLVKCVMTVTQQTERDVKQTASPYWRLGLALVVTRRQTQFVLRSAETEL